MKSAERPVAILLAILPEVQLSEASEFVGGAAEEVRPINASGPTEAYSRRAITAIHLQLPIEGRSAENQLIMFRPW